ncbi:MAG: hypothetical protein QF535_23505, partial [Anaerolineales bacterium]|nr:hypothetical protein [Anaerolineales bacterium]
MALTKVTRGGITADAIDGTKIADDAVDSEHYAATSVDNAHINDLAASKLTGALPAIDGASLTGITTDTTTIENNIALLGFYRAADNSKAKYNLVDQVIDEYTDATGIDAGNSTNESLTSGYYEGLTGSSSSVAFSYTGSEQSYTIPAGVTSVILKAWGASGGS